MVVRAGCAARGCLAQSKELGKCSRHVAGGVGRRSGACPCVRARVLAPCPCPVPCPRPRRRRTRRCSCIMTWQRCVTPHTCARAPCGAADVARQASRHSAGLQPRHYSLHATGRTEFATQNRNTYMHAWTSYDASRALCSRLLQGCSACRIPPSPCGWMQCCAQGMHDVGLVFGTNMHIQRTTVPLLWQDKQEA